MIPIAWNVGSLVARRTTTASAVLGIALVVFVLASSLMLSTSVRRTLGRSGHEDVAIVLRKGSDAELSSSVEVSNLNLIVDAPGVKRDASGAAIGVGEVVVVCAVDKIGTQGGISNVQVRGVDLEKARRLRPEVRFVAGGPFGPNEAVVGARLLGRFKGLEKIGQTFELKKNRSVKIVGVFEDGGSSFESELWADVDNVRQAFGRDGIVSSVRVRLESPSAFDAYKETVEHDKRLGLEAMRETSFYERQSEGLSIFVGALGSVIAVFFSVGAMIGAAITMLASVSSRHREIGTLRALGFSRRSVLTSLLLESLLIALAGGAIGCGASLALGFVKFSMMNMSSWSEVVFTFEPTPAILATAIAASVVMGLVGGFAPALRAALISPVEAMRGE